MRSAVLMAPDSLALAALRATASPFLKVESPVLLGPVLIVLETVTSSMHLLI